MNIVRFGVFVVVLLVSACGPRQLEPDEAIECDQCDSWNQPQNPFRVHGNTWYVGTGGLTSILIETDDGLILIDGGLPQSAALIDANIRNLGFDTRAVKAILVSHAHYDHVGGLAALQRLTGANVYASHAALRPLTTGRLVEDDPQYVADSDEGSFPPLRQVVAVDDGEVVTVGSIDVRAVHTPGHTPGSTTWTWQSCALNTCYDVVYADSMTAVSAQGFKFTSSGVGDEIIASAGKVADLDCDILLTPHPFFFGMDEKLGKIDQGNPFINNVGCLMYAESSLQWLEQRLQAERSH
ncbi:MAG: subclass B3 metallo-beta-lactamase [Gammaproteobacteria bacterium]|nr:subclass B3 metallo-beta-lactamase [Gammaproteobacteria bacterium]